MIIQFENITLSLIQEEDSAELFQLTDKNREYLRQWLPWLDITKTEEDTKSFIARSTEEFEQQIGLQLIIKQNGRVVGMIGLPKLDLNEEKAEIGYWIGQEYQGRGIMTKSCKTLIDYCFKELNLNTIEISCAVENEKSKSIPKRLGFKKIRTVKDAENLYGVMTNHELFELKKGGVG